MKLRRVLREYSHLPSLNLQPVPWIISDAKRLAHGQQRVNHLAHGVRVTRHRIGNNGHLPHGAVVPIFNAASGFLSSRELIAEIVETDRRKVNGRLRDRWSALCRVNHFADLLHASDILRAITPVYG